MTLQDKHNIRTLLSNVLASKQAWKARRWLATLPVSKARTNFYIYRQVYVILYLPINVRIYNIRTLSVNIKFIWTSFRYRQSSNFLASFSGLFRSEYKWILYLTTMYVYCVYPAMSKKSENLSDLNKKDRNKRHSSPFINVVKGVFFVVRVTLVPVSYLSAPSAVHSYRVPGKFIRRLKSLFV